VWQSGSRHPCLRHSAAEHSGRQRILRIARWVLVGCEARDIHFAQHIICLKRRVDPRYTSSGGYRPKCHKTWKRRPVLLRARFSYVPERDLLTRPDKSLSGKIADGLPSAPNGLRGVAHRRPSLRVAPQALASCRTAGPRFASLHWRCAGRRLGAMDDRLCALILPFSLDHGLHLDASDGLQDATTGFSIVRCWVPRGEK